MANELFVVADKFNSAFTSEDNIVTGHLCAIDKEKVDFLEKRMNILDQRIMYGNLHGTYKKALQKALEKKSRSLRLIEILEDFVNNSSEDEDKEDDNEGLDEEDEELSNESDKENIDFQLQNPKIKRGKGRPAGTKRYKASHEKNENRQKGQRRCKKCGSLGHYQKKCNA
jgi:hypothetical protein